MSALRYLQMAIFACVSAGFIGVQAIAIKAPGSDAVDKIKEFIDTAKGSDGDSLSSDDVVMTLYYVKNAVEQKAPGISETMRDLGAAIRKLTDVIIKKEENNPVDAIVGLLLAVCDLLEAENIEEVSQAFGALFASVLSLVVALLALLGPIGLSIGSTLTQGIAQLMANLLTIEGMQNLVDFLLRVVLPVVQLLGSALNPLLGTLLVPLLHGLGNLDEFGFPQ